MRKFIRKPLYTEQLKQWLIEAIDAEGLSVEPTDSTWMNEVLHD